METETYIKTSHARGKDGEGERWERGDVAGCRNVFDNGDTRTQEAITYEHHPQDKRIKKTEVAPTCGTFGNSIEGKDCLVQNPVAVLDTQGGKIGGNYQMGCDTTPTITRGRGSADDVHSVAYRYAVRRITPVEGERLQGFADNWTRPCFRADDITDELVDRFCGIQQNWSVICGKPDAKPPSRKKVRAWLEKISSADCPDGPRYKAIGNSMSVNVMQWIGLQIDEADKQERSAV